MFRLPTSRAHVATGLALRPGATAARWLFLLWWALVSVAAGANPIVLDTQTGQVSLAQRSQFWVDPGGQMGVDEVERRQATLPFALRDSKHRVQLDGGAALWIRFEALTQDRRTLWNLELAHSGVDSVSLFYRAADGSWQAQHAGDSLPVRAWPSRDRYPVFALASRTGEAVTYWARIEHARVPFSGELFISTYSNLLEQRIAQQFLLGGYFGMALLLMAVAVANGLVFRDTSFFAYALYTTLLALALSASLGVGGQLLWPDAQHWNAQAEFVLLPLVAVAGLLFVRRIIRPRHLGRWLNRSALVLTTALLVLTAWDQFHPSLLGLQLSTGAGALTLVVVYAMIWSAWRTGDRWVRWIAVGILPVLLAGTVPVLRNFGWLSSGFFTQYGMVIAATLEAPLLFYGLLQRSSLRQEARTRAKALVRTEPLTGLTNRHHGLLRLHDSLVRGQRYGHQIGLLLIELNNHAWFEQEHGREVADRALVLTGSLLDALARDVDTATRVSNNRFSLLIEGPARSAQLVVAATSIVAGGLRPATQLPVGAVLRFKVVAAMLPDSQMEFLDGAQAQLAWLDGALDDLCQDKRRHIQSLNF